MFFYSAEEIQALKKIVTSPIEFLAHNYIPSKISLDNKDTTSDSDTVIPSKLELGEETKIKKTIIHDFRKKIKHFVSEYPLVLFGANSSGRTTTALSLVSQWLKNKEGCIILNNGSSIYNLKKINTFIVENNSKQEVYILNLLNQYSTRDEKDRQFIDQLTLDSIDPINPLIGNENIFKLLFGNELGLVIHEISKVAKRNNMLLDYNNIQSMLSLYNLNNWVKNNTWNEATPVIHQYLLEQDEESHIQLCLPVQRYLNIIETYTNKGTFSINPTVDLKNIFINKSVLHCLFPSWHEVPEYSHYSNNDLAKSFRQLDYQRLGDLISLQILHITEQLIQEDPKSYLYQNIAVIEFEHTCSNKINQYLFNNLSHSNWLFSGYMPVQETDSYKTIEEMNKLDLIDVANTIVLMQSNTYSSEIPNKLKLKLLNKVTQLDNIFYEKSRYLSEQREGWSYVMIKINGKYEFIKMNLFYQYFNKNDLNIKKYKNIAKKEIKTTVLA